MPLTNPWLAGPAPHRELPRDQVLRRDAQVSAAVFAPLVGQASSRGAQFFGTVRTLARDDPRRSG